MNDGTLGQNQTDTGTGTTGVIFSHCGGRRVARAAKAPGHGSHRNAALENAERWRIKWLEKFQVHSVSEMITA